jgi:hypothetical protein
MVSRSPSDGRNRRRGTSSTRRGYTFPRAEHRHPVYGSQAKRDHRQGPYIIGFIFVVAALAGFLYIGLNWATGPGRAASLTNMPTPTPILIVQTEPTPVPTVGDQIYVVKSGDNPAAIAQQFRIKTEDLMAANGIDDPSKLQVGQTLRIPPPATAPR